MSKHKKESFFWTSYSDLMTSLFFVMLLLFVLTITLLHNRNKATEEQLRKIKEIEESVKNINKDYFAYDETFKRHTLKNISISFNTNSSNINDIPSDELKRLEIVGKSILGFVEEAVALNPGVKYLLIVEGQSSKDNYYHNDELSYRRALALKMYWKDKGIDFDNSKHCEIIISGSGQSSPFRVAPDNASNRANQRFVIHIIPKIGEIRIN